jgi:hypothetical protein
MPVSELRQKNHWSAIFARVWNDASGSFTPQLARHVLKIGFSDVDKARMHELARKNSDGTISSIELAELGEFVVVGDLIGILHAKARILLKRRAKLNGKHG